MHRGWDPECGLCEQGTPHPLPTRCSSPLPLSAVWDLSLAAGGQHKDSQAGGAVVCGLCKLFLGLDLGRGLGNCFLLKPPPQNGILECCGLPRVG